MKARFTIIVATLLASSLFGDFFQSRNNRTPKGETGDLAETIGDLKAKISSLEGQVDDLRRSNRELMPQKAKEPKPEKQPVHEADLNRLRARIKQLERQLAEQDAAASEEPVEQLATNRVEGSRRFGPPTFAELEDMRKNDPERYVQTTNRIAQFRAGWQERLQNQFDILERADTAHMTEKQRKVHEDYKKLLVRIDELREQLNPLADVPEEQRRAAVQEMREAWHQLHELQLIERDTLLTQTVNSLGYKGEDAKIVVDGIKAVYEATGGGSLRGSRSLRGHRGQGPDQSHEKEGINTSIKIQISRTRDMKDAFAFNGTEVDLKRLDELLKTTAATRPEVRVLVYSDTHCRYESVAQVLDICKKYKIKCSIMSVDGRKE